MIMKLCQSIQKTRKMLPKMTLVKKLHIVAISNAKVDESTYQQPKIVLDQLKYGRSEEYCFSQHRSTEVISRI